jgi:hypothetical protein
MDAWFRYFLANENASWCTGRSLYQKIHEDYDVEIPILSFTLLTLIVATGIIVYYL